MVEFRWVNNIKFAKQKCLKTQLEKIDERIFYDVTLHTAILLRFDKLLLLYIWDKCDDDDDSDSSS